jgi:hypothetical protein
LTPPDGTRTVSGGGVLQIRLAPGLPVVKVIPRIHPPVEAVFLFNQNLTT